MLNPHGITPPELREKNLKVCPHCQARYFRLTKGICPNCKRKPSTFKPNKKRLTKPAPDKACACGLPYSIAKYIVVFVDNPPNPPCG